MELKKKNTQQKPKFIPFEDQYVLRKTKLLIVTVRLGQSDAIQKIFDDYNVSMSVTTLGSGETFEFDRITALSKKEFIFAIVCEDKVEPIMRKLQERFALSRQAQGIAYTIDITSIAGVSVYKFLTNTRKVTKVSKNGKRKQKWINLYNH